ncbi:MAG TPA: lysophospholipid acyltransferase family protein [Candidatus Acidoferrales bacterium]|nr:lysophospholipid acyltransferase family protein [Candidatus Acidoferrales bacterium]
MRAAYLKARSLALWAISGVHFFVVCTLLVGLGAIVDPRKNDRAQRIFFRNILRLAGVKFKAQRSSGFDARRTSLFVCNHVNIFDPFVIYSAIPQFVRGFELASHFKVPAYGWMMGRFGNIPVPDENNRSREAMAEMTRKAELAFASGISLIAFAEGSRTRDGHVGPFQKGVFRLAVRFAIPIVPMSIVGSYEFHRTGHWMLNPGKIIVYLHDTIETKGMPKEDAAELRERVHAIVAAPVEEHIAQLQEAAARSGSPEKVKA